MGYFLVYLLIVISYGTGVATGTNPPIALWLQAVLGAIAGLIAVALFGLINRSASCRDLSDTNYGSGKTEKSK